MPANISVLKIFILISVIFLYLKTSVKNEWSQPMHMNLGVPTKRAAHGMCTVDQNLVIFGGRDTEKRTNDLHIFNVRK